MSIAQIKAGSSVSNEGGTVGTKPHASAKDNVGPNVIPVPECPGVSTLRMVKATRETSAVLIAVGLCRFLVPTDSSTGSTPATGRGALGCGAEGHKDSATCSVEGLSTA